MKKQLSHVIKKLNFVLLSNIPKILNQICFLSVCIKINKLKMIFDR